MSNWVCSICGAVLDDVALSLTCNKCKTQKEEEAKKHYDDYIRESRAVEFERKLKGWQDIVSPITETNVPLLYYNLTRSDFKVYTDILRGFVTKLDTSSQKIDMHNIVITGAASTGKTYLAGKLMFYFTDRVYTGNKTSSCGYISVANLNIRNLNYSALLELPFLIIDDVSAVDDTIMENVALNIIYPRLRSLQRTIFIAENNTQFNDILNFIVNIKRLPVPADIIDLAITCNVKYNRSSTFIPKASI